MAGSTKSAELTTTKLMRITQMSGARPDSEFKWLMPHFNVSSLRACYDELDGKKAVGADGISKETYGKDLESRLVGLEGRMKTLPDLWKIVERKLGGHIRYYGAEFFNQNETVVPLV